MQPNVDDNTRNVYDQAAERYVEVFLDDLSDSIWLDRLSAAVHSPALILDVGSGPGQFAQYLSRATNVVVVALDLSMGMLQSGRRAGVNVPMVQAAMNHLPFGTGVFDAILVAYSFLHVPRLIASAVMTDLARVTKPGGTCLMMVKEGTGEECIPASLVPSETLHVTYWNMQTLTELAGSTGWKVVQTDVSMPTSEVEIQRRKIAFWLERRPNG